MNEKRLELELWRTREELAGVQLELWQYRRLEAQQRSLRVAKELEVMETEDAN